MNTNMLPGATNGASSQRIGVLDEWYVYQEGGAHLGPVTLDLLARGIASGKVPRTAFAGPAGCGEWHGVLEYPQIVAALAAVEKSPDATIQMAPPSLSAFATPTSTPTSTATATATATPTATPTATATSTATATATSTPTPTATATAKPAAKPDEKKDVLDPRYRFLPLAIFGASAFIATIELIVGLVAAR